MSKKKNFTPLKKGKEVEDRSAYNCPTCLGEGLDVHEKLCPQCLGTGKI